MDAIELNTVHHRMTVQIKDIGKPGKRWQAMSDVSSKSVRHGID